MWDSGGLRRRDQPNRARSASPWTSRGRRPGHHSRGRKCDLRRHVTVPSLGLIATEPTRRQQRVRACDRTHPQPRGSASHQSVAGSPSGCPGRLQQRGRLPLRTRASVSVQTLETLARDELGSNQAVWPEYRNPGEAGLATNDLKRPTRRQERHRGALQPPWDQTSHSPRVRWPTRRHSQAVGIVRVHRPRRRPRQLAVHPDRGADRADRRWWEIGRAHV